jgi:hypothetical protein
MFYKRIELIIFNKYNEQNSTASRIRLETHDQHSSGPIIPNGTCKTIKNGKIKRNLSLQPTYQQDQLP